MSFCVQSGHLHRQVAQLDLLFLFFFFFEKIKEREKDLFSSIFIIRSDFFYVVKQISISYLEYQCLTECIVH